MQNGFNFEQLSHKQFIKNNRRFHEIYGLAGSRGIMRLYYAVTAVRLPIIVKPDFKVRYDVHSPQGPMQ